MRPLDNWLRDYGADHLNATNKKIHRVCVPLIFFAVVGVLRLIPYHIGEILIALALVWYAFLGVKALVLMLAQLTVAILLVDLLRAQTDHALWVLTAIFVIGWVGQFYGHKLEGRRPSFLRDLQYLLIGPIWVWLGEH